jgi:hypothetical protein
VIGSVTAYAANPVACQKLNTKLGNCANTHVFTDVMTTPSNGVVPSGARVLVFLSANPDVDIIPAGAYAALCGQGQIFVAFGNYSGSTPLLFGHCWRPFHQNAATCLVEARLLVASPKGKRMRIEAKSIIIAWFFHDIHLIEHIF